MDNPQSDNSGIDSVYCYEVLDGLYTNITDTIPFPLSFLLCYYKSNPIIMHVKELFKIFLFYGEGLWLWIFKKGPALWAAENSFPTQGKFWLKIVECIYCALPISTLPYYNAYDLDESSLHTAFLYPVATTYNFSSSEESTMSAHRHLLSVLSACILETLLSLSMLFILFSPGLPMK